MKLARDDVLSAEQSSVGDRPSRRTEDTRICPAGLQPDNSAWRPSEEPSWLGCHVRSRSLLIRPWNILLGTGGRAPASGQTRRVSPPGMSRLPAKNWCLIVLT